MWKIQGQNALVFFYALKGKKGEVNLPQAIRLGVSGLGFFEEVIDKFPPVFEVPPIILNPSARIFLSCLFPYSK